MDAQFKLALAKKRMCWRKSNGNQGFRDWTLLEPLLSFYLSSWHLFAC